MRVTRSVYTESHERFRALMVEARKKVGLSQVDLARKVHRPQSYVSKYERGERRIDVVEFLEISEALGMDPATLMRRLRRPRGRRADTGP